MSKFGDIAIFVNCQSYPSCLEPTSKDQIVRKMIFKNRFFPKCTKILKNGTSFDWIFERRKFSLFTISSKLHNKSPFSSNTSNAEDSVNGTSDALYTACGTSLDIILFFIFILSNGKWGNLAQYNDRDHK